jgi:hypothetical protein
MSYARQFDWGECREYVLRECGLDWDSLRLGRSLDEMFNLFARLAELPTGDAGLDGFADQLLAAVCNYFSASNVHDRGIAFLSLAVCMEVGLKRLLKLADPKTYESLHVVAEPGKPPRSPMLTDLLNCPRLGLVNDTFARRYEDFAWRARNLRNKSSHNTPAWSERELSQGFADFWLTLLVATAKNREALERVILEHQHQDFVRQSEPYLRDILRRWCEHVRRWILLEGQELPSDDDLGLAELTAGELPIEGSEDDAEGGADTENETEDEWEDSDNEDETEYEQDEFEEGESGEPEEYAPLPELRRGKVHDLFDQVGRLVLIANAGAGKTTSLQHYAYLQAKALLDNPCELRPLPLYVELRYYQASLWQLITAALQVGGQQPSYDENRLRQEIAQGKWVLLLDGLNEVPNDRREQAFRELEWIIQQNGQTRLVITSRRDMPLERLKLPVFRLDPLTDDQIVDFLKRHFPDKRQAETFARTLRRNPRLWDWGRNPLQLWMLAQVGLRARGGLPENRGQLLRRFVEYLLRREESKGPQTPRDIKLDLLSEIGYQTRQSGRVSFPRQQAWQIVRQRSQEMGYGVDSVKFAHEVCDNHLLADQGDQLAFAHEMYQEYFAACGLKWRYEADPRVVEPLQGQPQWREPLVLLWGLLESPQTLFQRIVRDQPAVAAECLASAVQPKPDEQEQLRQRILQVNYRTASDDELRKVLEAIYVLGDGSLLAQHLQERRRHNRLKGIGRQIAEAFTGDEPALRATLDALKQLGKSANVFSEPLLQPLQAKDLKILAELQREAAQLWRTWRAEYKFAPIHLFLLASAFRLQNLLADDICQVIESLLQQGQWKAALREIEKFGLQREAFAEAAAAGVRRLLEQGQWEAALRRIQEFCLASRFPPEPIIERLLELGQWKAALWGIQAFGLQREAFAEAAAEEVRRLLQQGRCEAALRGIEAFGMAARYPPEPIIEKLLQQGQWVAALRGIWAFRLVARYPPEPIIGKLLQQGQWGVALWGIEAFGLQREAFAEAAAAGVGWLLEQGQWGVALWAIEAFGLQREAFAEAAAAGVRRLLEQGQWDAALRGIEAFRLQREAFAEAAAKGVWRLVQQAQYEAAVTGARHFHVWDLLHDYLADRFHADRDLDWMIAARQRHRRLTTGVATVLLRRYGDVENALALVGSLGFSREHIEHNRALIERVEKINQALAQTGALPEREDMRDLELFGYVHESGWILTPGSRDFRISESAKQHGLVRRVVRFRLVVERRSSDGRLVLNATNLVPA